MSRIFCIIGKSSSGKDTLYENILEFTTEKIIPIVPYTTRPKRTNEKDGVAYHFVSEEQMNIYEANNQIIEKRAYSTSAGVWYYFTLHFSLSESTDYILISTLEGVKNLISYFGEDLIHVLYLFTDDKTRLLRCINREEKQLHPNYNEVCRRFLADQEDFPETELKKIKNIYYINTNSSMKKCISEWSKIYEQAKQ